MGHQTSATEKTVGRPKSRTSSALDCRGMVSDGVIISLEHASGCDFDSRACFVAATGGHLAVIQRPRATVCDWVCACAATAGQGQWGTSRSCGGRERTAARSQLRGGGRLRRPRGAPSFTQPPHQVRTKHSRIQKIRGDRRCASRMLRRARRGGVEASRRLGRCRSIHALAGAA